MEKNSRVFSRPFGTHQAAITIPALKRRAIFGHPFGMKAPHEYICI
jgi:hypothetical protein